MKRRPLSQGVGDHPPEIKNSTGKPSPWLGRSHVARMGRPVLDVCHEHDMHEPCVRCERGE